MKKLFDVLSQEIENSVGFEETNALYSESFRSPESFSSAEAPAMLEDMIYFLTSDVYPAAPAFCDYEECDYEPEPIALGMSRDDAIAMINGGIRFVYTCNYKGEDDGIIPEFLSNGMRVFVSKYNYL